MFSIIIPCYKVAQWIRPCLDSVLAQGDADWEAICVDDGSPDTTGAILDEYAARDPRIKVIHQKNGGSPSARNAALAVAQGEWLVYLDGDDVLPPGVFKRVRAALAKAPDVDVVWGDMVKFEDGEEPKWPEPKDEKSCVADVSKTVCARHFGCYFQVFYFRRSVFGQIRFEGVSVGDDRRYVAMCMTQARRILETNLMMYGLRIRSSSITHAKMSLKLAQGNFDATRDMMRVVTTCGKAVDPSLVRLLLTDWTEWFTYVVVAHLDATDRPAAWRYWFEHLKESEAYRPMMTPWRRFSVWACCALPFRSVAMLLIVLPAWLKRKGIHR